RGLRYRMTEGSIAGGSAGPVTAGNPPPPAVAKASSGVGPPTVPPPDSRAVEEVLVLDFGGQYSQLIARRIRECGVFAELLPASTAVEKIVERKPKALILSGGPASVYEPGAPEFPTQLLDLEIPMLGICYGMQAMVLVLGGRVETAESGEFGRTALVLRDGGGRLLGGLPEEQSCWMSHRDAVFAAPEGFT